MTIYPQDLRITTYLPQSGQGAGGMQIGLNPSGIIVHHIPTGLGVSCDSERSQHANREKAIKMLEHVLRRDALISSTSVYSDVSFLTEQANLPSKVMAIKNVRERVGCGLKEAKEAVDKYWGLPECEELAVSSFGGGNVKCASII